MENKNPADFRPFIEDLLRLGLQGREGYTNRPVDQIQLEYITNPYGRQPPHLIVFPDGRIEQMTSFQIPVPGFGPNVLAVEVIGLSGQAPTPTQLETIARFGGDVREMMPGRLGFTGHADLVACATGALSPSAESATAPVVSAPATAPVATPDPAPFFMNHSALAMSQPAEPTAARTSISLDPAPSLDADIHALAPMPAKRITVQAIFDILGTPDDRRAPLPPGSIFNNSFAPGRGAAPVEIRIPFKAPNTRDIVRLVIVPSHEASKPEPESAEAYTLDALRKADQRVGMSDFRGHFLLTKDGQLLSGRSLELTGNCWPGKNDGALQVVLAGNGKSPTEEQRRCIYEFGVAMRRHYEKPLQASVRDIVFAEQLLGIDPNGMMREQLANATFITADVTAKLKQQARA